MVTTTPMVLCSVMTLRVPSSAACARGISCSNQGVWTMRGWSPSDWPMAPSTMKPTQSMSRRLQRVPSSAWMETASSGTNFGSAVMMVLPEPLWGSSSFARSFR